MFFSEVSQCFSSGNTRVPQKNACLIPHCDISINRQLIPTIQHYLVLANQQIFTVHAWLPIQNWKIKNKLLSSILHLPLGNLRGSLYPWVSELPIHISLCNVSFGGKREFIKSSSSLLSIFKVCPPPKAILQVCAAASAVRYTSKRWYCLAAEKRFLKWISF